MRVTDARDNASYSCTAHEIPRINSLTHAACGPHGPIAHYTYTLILPVRARATGLDDLIKGLKAEAPVPAWRSVPPHLSLRHQSDLRRLPVRSSRAGADWYQCANLRDFCHEGVRSKAGMAETAQANTDLQCKYHLGLRSTPGGRPFQFAGT
jgi:hypothetical protein